MTTDHASEDAHQPVQESTQRTQPTGGQATYARLSYRLPNREIGYKNILRSTTVIGSASDCHIRLMSPDICSAHSVITLDDESLRVRNLHSGIGTRVNGIEVDVCDLAHGDKLECGPFVFYVETNLTFELSKTAAILDTRLDNTAADGTPQDTAVDTDGKSPLTMEFLKKLMLQGQITKFQADWLMNGEFEEFEIDHYKVLEILGNGGMGWLYVALDPETKKKIALKVISKQQDIEFLTRFKLEARAGQMLDHPNIVRTYKMGERDDIYYVVMELVEGVNLQEMIYLKKAVPWEASCSFMAQTARALENAHKAGMVHRDIKPANLLITADGTVKILDFGLALIDEDEDEFTLAMISGQDCVGTADFIAPEQTIDSYTVDGRADIYSLGCTFYCALTGVVPFPGESISRKLRAHRNREARPIREWNSEVPEKVAKIVEKAMARRPEDRFQSAADLRKALKPFAKRTPVTFDFREVLAKRVEEAKARVARLQKRK